MLLQSCRFFSRPDNILNPSKGHFSIRKNSRIRSYFPFRCVSKLACPATIVGDVASIFQNKLYLLQLGNCQSQLLQLYFMARILMSRLRFRLEGSLLPIPLLWWPLRLPLVWKAVVYASLVMYDARGVRREVGIHAKELNKVLLSTRKSSNSGKFTNSFPGESSSDLESTDPLFLEEQSFLQTKQANGSVLLRSGNRKQSTTVRSSGVGSDVGEESVSVSYGSSTLKESVGHTENEVVAGAVLGFIVSLAICRYL